MSPRSELPLIGVTTYREQARWGVWDVRADVLHAQYADAVLTAGGVPVLLPPASTSDAVAAVVVSRLDALVVSGGADVDPARYGEDPHPSTAAWREDRDAWETALVHAADAAGLPTLGVCRGMQLMAVAAGGSLLQHTPDLVGHDGHSPGADAFGTTEVTTAEESRLRDSGRARRSRSAATTTRRWPRTPVSTRPPGLPTAPSRRWSAPGPASAWLSSGTPRSRDDASLFAGLVAAATAR